MTKSSPDFVAQTAEPTTTKERWDWFCSTSIEMRFKGATWLQQSVDDADAPKVCLVEGWRDRPDTQPSPHFMLVEAVGD